MRKYEEGVVLVGDGRKCDDEDGRNIAGMGGDLQVCVSYSATLRERELGSDGGNTEGDGGVPPSISTEDRRYVR